MPTLRDFIPQLEARRRVTLTPRPTLTTLPPIMPTARRWTILLLLLAAVLTAAGDARAQPADNNAGGDVMQIGFDGVYQPDAWVPMKVRLTPPGGESGLYRLRVHQQDLDGDNVVFERSLTLTGGLPNQQFWTYFKPQPVNPIPAGDVNGLRERLRVVLADEDGREIAQLAVGRGVVPLYSGPGGPGSALGNDSRGQRLVLCVADPAGGFFPGGQDYGLLKSYGFNEGVAAVSVTTGDLPDRAIGYDGVDVVVWQDADPAVLAEGDGARLEALKAFVRRGGHLVITARSEWQTLEAFGDDLLPVTPTAAEPEETLENLLPLLANARQTPPLAPFQAGGAGPFRFIVSRAKPDAVVEQTFRYGEAEPATAETDAAGGVEGGVAEPNEDEADTRPTAPLLARRPYGFGCVTWLALDLSNRNVLGTTTSRTSGWPVIWSRVLGSGDTPIINASPTEEDRYRFAGFKDLGESLLSGTRLAGRSAALVTIALVFFIAYWLLAGPGTYFYLASKKKTPLSWFAFGAVALVATVVTLGVVRLVLGGSAELRHFSLARQGRVAPQVVHSEIGLYIPRDGEQRISVDGGAEGERPTITAYAVDPAHRGVDGSRTNPVDYAVSLDPPPPEVQRYLQGSAAAVDVPYRSTLKKIESTWVGPPARGVEGAPRLIDGRGLVAGALSNLTGRELSHVYICFRHPRASGDDPFVVYIPRWPAGQTINGLDSLIDPQDGTARMKVVDRQSSTLAGPPSARSAVYGQLRRDWAPRYFYGFLRSSLLSAGTVAFDDSAAEVRTSHAMLTLFDLLPPMTNDAGQGSGQSDATALLRRGARELDLSAAVLAGQMVIVAEADGAELPLPLAVNGREVDGSGRVVYQFVLPVDRNDLDKQEEQEEPATQPADDAPAEATP